MQRVICLLSATVSALLLNSAHAQCKDFSTIGDPNNTVYAITTFDEDGPGPNPPRLFIGGTFDLVGDVAAQGIARWDGTSWTPVGLGLSSVYTLAVFDDGTGPALYAGGGFSTPGNHIAKWNGTDWLPLGAGVNQNALTMAVYDDGSGPALFVGGNFTTAGAVSSDHIASWNGTSWRTWAAGPSNRIWSSMTYDSVHNNVILFGGQVPGSSLLSDTWLWNGFSWTQAAASGAGARSHATMTFDTLRGRALMMDTTSGDTLTWSWNGTAWSQITGGTIVPVQRGGFRMAYDAARDRVVLFGGVATYNSSLYYGDTWEFDGTNWTDVTTANAPSARQQYVIAYDSVRQRTVLFGGVNSAQGYLGDTWEYDGTNWSLRATTGPTARNNAYMAFDTARARCILYGGTDGQASKQTWAWNGTSWSMLDAGQPEWSARSAAPIAYDSSQDRVVQRDPTGVQWSWNGTAWSTIPGGGINGSVAQLVVHDDGSGPALYACGTFGLAGGAIAPNVARLTSSGWGPVGDGLGGNATSMASYGGLLYASGPFGLLRWNGAAWSAGNNTGTGLSGSGALSVADDGSGPRLYATGGFVRGGLGGTSMVSWDGSVWRSITSTGTEPGPREYAAMAYDTSRARTVLFGGTSDGTSAGSLNSTFEWDGRAWSQITASGPSARWGHTMAYDAAGDRVILVGGGTSPATADSQTWSWNGTSWTSLATSFGTDTRFQHAMCYDIARNRVVLFGGRQGASGALSDTWEFDGTTWTQRPVSGPPARYAHAMAYDSDRQRTVMVGGITTGGAQLFDTWEWDGSQWNLRNNNSGTATGPISDHIMAYDTVRQRTVLYGGRKGEYDSAKLWEWDGSIWTNPAVAAGVGNAAAYDSRLQTLVVYGGLYDFRVVEATNLRGGTNSWSAPGGGLGTLTTALAHDDGNGPALFMTGSAMGTPPSHIVKWGASCSEPTITTHPVSQSSVFSHDVVFTTAATGTRTAAYQWRCNGVNLHDVSNYIIGATTAQLTIHGWSLNDAGQYDVVVSNVIGSVVSNPATLTVNGSVPGSPVTVTRIVYAPDPVPGMPGTTFNMVRDPILSPTEEVLFVGRAAGTDYMLCLWDAGTLQVLYKAYDTIAGTAPGEYVNYTNSGISMFSRFGTMGNRRFWFTTDLGGPGINVTNRRGLWYQDDSGATLVARRGNRPAGFAVGTAFSQFGDIYPTANTSGDIAFSSWVDTNGVRTGGGAWSWSLTGGQSNLARVGDPAPGTSVAYSWFGNGIAINNDGRTILGANLPSSGSGAWAGIGSTFEPVLLSGTPAPGAPAGSTLLGAGIEGNLLSNSGIAAIYGAYTTTPDPTVIPAFYRVTPEGISPFVYRGMPALGAPSGDTFNTPSTWSINDAGDVLFSATLRTLSCLPPTCPNAGLWLSAADGLHPVMLNYSTPPDGTPIAFDKVAPVGPGVVNNSGIVIFVASLTGPGQTSVNAVYGWTLASGAFPISVPGTQMEVRPGLFKTVSQAALTTRFDSPINSTTNLTDLGTMVMTVTFTDNSTGLFKGEFGEFFVGRFPCQTFISPIVQTIAEGATATFAASAAGSGVSYQWQHNGIDLSDNLRTSGASSSVLTISPVAPVDAGSYSCIVINSCGQALSPIATLGVINRCGSADFDGDGDTGTDADIEAFFACLGGSCCPTCFSGGADFNGDGDTGTDADIESFFHVLGGGPC